MAFNTTNVNVNVNINNTGAKSRKGTSAAQVSEVVEGAVRGAKTRSTRPATATPQSGPLEQVARGCAEVCEGAVDVYVGAARVYWSFWGEALTSPPAEKSRPKKRARAA